MLKIDSVEWAKVKIEGKSYWQVLIIGGEVMVREVERVKQEYGNDHVIANWEKDSLLSKSPDAIVIADGWSEILKVDEEFKRHASDLGINLKVLRTPEAVEEYNRLAKEGKKVNTLIHTTC